MLSATSLIAGPGPEYWARMNPKAQTSYPSIWRKTAKEMSAKVKPAAEVAPACASCTGCQGAKKE